MNIAKDIFVEGQHGKPILLDAFFPSGEGVHPIILFAHGFKGFKDWGHWHLIAEAFAQAGFIFIKFNFSHNGTTPAQPLDFADLEAFGQNNYSKELADLDTVLDWIQQQDWYKASTQPIGLVGHSRGGGISIVKAGHDTRIKALATWAAVSTLDYGWKDNAPLVQKWKEDGVQFLLNGRTRQNMPLYFQLYEDFEANADLLSTQSALQKRPEMDYLIVHGTDDPVVSMSMAEQLLHWHPRAQLHAVAGANHVFGGSHPFTASQLTAHAQALVDHSIRFFKEVL